MSKAAKVPVGKLCITFEEDMGLKMNGFIKEFNHSGAQKTLSVLGKGALREIHEHLQTRKPSKISASTDERVLRGWCYLLSGIQQQAGLPHPEHHFSDFPAWVTWLEAQSQ